MGGYTNPGGMYAMWQLLSICHTDLWLRCTAATIIWRRCTGLKPASCCAYSLTPSEAYLVGGILGAGAGVGHVVAVLHCALLEIALRPATCLHTGVLQGMLKD